MPTQLDPMQPKPATTSPGCEAWQPSGEDWSAVADAQPQLLESFTASHSGEYLYAIGRWADAGAPQHRVLRSSDAGSTWCLLSASPSADTVVASRADESTVYVEEAPDSDGTRRLSRSGDAGITWSAVDLAPEIAGHLEASLTQPNIIWFQQDASLNVSIDGGDSWALERPPVWEQTETSMVLESGQGFVVDPTSAQRVIAKGTVFAGTGPTEQRSYVTEDSGQTWSVLPPPPDGVDFSAAFADAGGMLYATVGGHLQRSSDWGKTWTDTGQRPELTNLPTTLGSTTPGLLYLPATDHLWTSTDAGSHWSSQSIASSSSPLLALDRSTLLAFDPAGLAISKDAGQSWQVNLRASAPVGLVESPLAPNLIWALSTAYQEERDQRRTPRPSQRSDDGGNTWSPVPDINPYLVLDGADPLVVYDGLTVTTQRRSEDGGRSWTPLAASALATAVASCVSGASCLYILNQYWLEATRSFSCQLARSDDGGRNESQPWEVPLSICQTGVLAVAPDSPDHLLAGCENSMCESHDGGHSFETHIIDANPRRYVGSLTFLPSGVALLATRNVTEPGFEASAVFMRSVDAGLTWVAIKGLAPLSTAHFSASYAQPGVVFAVGDLGRVFRSDDDGSTWRQASPPADDGTAVRYDDPASFLVLEIVDHAGGGFLASTNQGLVHFE